MQAKCGEREPTFQGTVKNMDKNPLLEVTKNMSLVVNTNVNNNDGPLREKVNLDILMVH